MHKPEAFKWDLDGFDITGVYGTKSFPIMTEKKHNWQDLKFLVKQGPTRRFEHGNRIRKNASRVEDKLIFKTFMDVIQLVIMAEMKFE